MARVNGADMDNDGQKIIGARAPELLVLAVVTTPHTFSVRQHV